MVISLSARRTGLTTGVAVILLTLAQVASLYALLAHVRDHLPTLHVGVQVSNHARIVSHMRAAAVEQAPA